MSRVRPLLATLAAATLLVTGAVVGTPGPAWAANYPSWDDVLGARASEAAKAAEVTRLEGLLTQLEADVKAKEKVAKQKGDEYFEAQQAYDEAAFKAQQLQEQADTAQLQAEESMLQAGQLAARTQRAGGADITATLLFGQGSADNLLGQLGMASKVSEQSSGVFAKAKQDQNTAQSLTDQANLAKAALEELAAVAQRKMEEAQAAADAAFAALEEQQDHKARLQAQLATLKENRLATEAEYTAGIKALWGEGAAGVVSATGWARPSAGYISSGYGWRVPPKSGASSLHGGIDLAPGCNAPIFAAHSGTVEYAGWNGGYGYYIRINHGDGTSSAYGHIVAGGIRVSAGQRVGPGQLIAHVGTTGTSTGCHLHFEVRVGGATTDPATFLRGQGVSI
ncbi:peptidoglycan DD-metalloendopeptidase family protein [Salinibacterium sp. SYSU T00001]|uniref:peptidoglycan DD-metalloendopeptidase family protein n=1 Tax=Homoserinimonas sedimenticola TaxID=2986805 RepID=UPI0022358831|nr:peptidoglycan DD-metalloendopeptidase family protein [Salinibacterium sedimenticola]MCW4385420.1 peptidoglycan DD-metalloendopeptidase family protein [Salinibacterium sedimenticola]